MTKDDHGSPSTYSYHGCRCDACRAAWAADCRQRRLYRTASDLPPGVKHGLPNTYTNYGCRCPPCGDAHYDSYRDYRSRRGPAR